MAEPLGDVDFFEQLLLLGGLDAQRAGDQVGERARVVDVGDSHLQLLRQVGDLLDDLREGALDVAGEGLELGARLDLVGLLGDPRDQVRLVGDEVVEADALGRLDEDPQGAVGDFDHPLDHADDADAVEVGRVGSSLSGVARGDHHQHPVATEHVVDELDRARLADRERGDRVGEGDRVAQRQDRQRLRHRHGAAQDVLGVERRLDDLERGRALHQGRSIGTRWVVAPASRSGQFDGEDAVFVVGDGAARVDLDLQLDHAAEGTGGNLDLLVDAALGLLQDAAADDRELPAGDLDPDLGEVDAGEVDFDHGTLRFIDVIDVDVGREARGPAADVAGASPGLVHQLVHLPAHPGKVGKEVALGHRRELYPRAARGSETRGLGGGRGAADGGDQVAEAARPVEAQRGARIRRTGWRGGTRPSGRLGRKVAHASSSSNAQSPFLEKKQSSQAGALGLRGIGSGIKATWPSSRRT